MRRLHSYLLCTGCLVFDFCASIDVGLCVWGRESNLLCFFKGPTESGLNQKQTALQAGALPSINKCSGVCGDKQQAPRDLWTRSLCLNSTCFEAGSNYLYENVCEMCVWAYSQFCDLLK